MEDNHIMDILGNYVEILERENDSLKAEIKSLEKLIDAKHKKRNEDSNLIAELKLAIVDQNDDIKTLNARIIDLRDKVKSKMRLGDEFQRDLIVSNDINKELRRQVKTLQAKNKELKLCSDVAFVELLTKDNDYLKSEVKALEEENDSLKDEAVKWNRKHNKLQDEALKPTFH